MHRGHYISGAGHLTLIGWVMLGGVFTSDPPPFETTEVSVISGAEFDAMVAAAQPPENATEVAQPEAPTVAPDPPEVAAVPDEVAPQPQPEPVETPPEDTLPEVVEDTPPPQAEVADAPPELDQPVGDVAVLVPSLAPTAVPRPVARVAPQAVAQPDPDAAIDPVEQVAVAPDETGETPEEPQEATAAPEATTEIVTEATAAPKASPRPPGRPAPPARPAAQTQTAENTVDEDAAAIAAQVAAGQTQAETPAAAAPTGPPLSQGEKEGLRVAVGQCWNYGSLSSDAQRTIVTVGVQMSKDGKPIISSIRLLGSSGGSEASAKNGFETARRAIIKCGSKGYPLPVEKYDHWKDIEITFNPEKMRRK